MVLAGLHKNFPRQQMRPLCGELTCRKKRHNLGLFSHTVFLRKTVRVEFWEGIEKNQLDDYFYMRAVHVASNSYTLCWSRDMGESEVGRFWKLKAHRIKNFGILRDQTSSIYYVLIELVRVLPFSNRIDHTIVRYDLCAVHVKSNKTCIQWSHLSGKNEKDTRISFLVSKSVVQRDLKACRFSDAKPGQVLD